MDRYWQQYTFCVVLTVLWPLLPLGFEWFTVDDVKVESVALTASMYAVGIGVASKNLALFAIAIVEACIFAMFYGLCVKGHPPHESWIWWGSLIGMALMFFCHTIERFNRHIRLQEPFPDFMK